MDPAEILLTLLGLGSAWWSMRANDEPPRPKRRGAPPRPAPVRMQTAPGATLDEYTTRVCVHTKAGPVLLEGKYYVAAAAYGLQGALQDAVTRGVEAGIACPRDAPAKPASCVVRASVSSGDEE